MRIGIWVTEGAWPAAVDAVAEWPDRSAEVVLLHVAGGGIEDTVSGAFSGLWGRGRRNDPAVRLAAEAQTASSDLLDRAAARLGRDCRRRSLTGRPERAVTEAAESLDLLVVARDGDLSRLGPRSLGPDTRFVVDHAPCRVLLVWPGSAPGLGSIPPPPPSPSPRPGRA
jgi:nucleotide-binding universal stress UspA family protein